MRTSIFILLLILSILQWNYSAAQQAKLVKLEELRSIYMKDDGKTYVVNFFATWCGPCVKEIPLLNDFNTTYASQNFQLLYVSLDNGNSIKKLPSFIKKKKMTAPVYVMNESADYSWLPYVDKRWQGSIPATMIVNASKKIKYFVETPLEKGQLEFYLKKLGLL